MKKEQINYDEICDVCKEPLYLKKSIFNGRVFRFKRKCLCECDGPVSRFSTK